MMQAASFAYDQILNNSAMETAVVDAIGPNGTWSAAGKPGTEAPVPGGAKAGGQGGRAPSLWRPAPGRTPPEPADHSLPCPGCPRRCGNEDSGRARCP